MKKGDFVCVHMMDGCSIGKILEVRNGVIDIEFDNGILMNVPIKVVTPWATAELVAKILIECKKYADRDGLDFRFVVKTTAEAMLEAVKH